MAGSGKPRRSLLSWLFRQRGGREDEDRGGALGVRVRRRALAAVACLDCDLQVPAKRWGEVVTVFAAAVAEISEGNGALAQVGIVADEAPVMLVFRLRRDLVASQVRDALTAGATHRRPTLWLTLPAGVYLATVIDPDAPFAASPEVITAIVAAGKVRHALLAEARPRAGGVVLRLALYSTSGGVRSAFRAARRVMSALPGWVSASARAQVPPRVALKTRLQR